VNLPKDDTKRNNPFDKNNLKPDTPGSSNPFSFSAPKSSPTGLFSNSSIDKKEGGSKDKPKFSFGDLSQP
jgi:hypothetical protein